MQKIWDRAPQNAFTDLVRHEGRWLCCFREAKSHGRGYGRIRVIESGDGTAWKSIAEIAEPRCDLRDPKLSIMPDGRLMMVTGGSIYDDQMRYLTRRPRVSFSKDGRTWTPPRRVLAEDHWLWRVTWHDDKAYSLSKLGEGGEERRGFLYVSRNGIDWTWITEFKLEGVSETTLRFMPDDELIALIRPGYIGHSKPPYRKWAWHKMKRKIGGPNFIRVPDGTL